MWQGVTTPEIQLGGAGTSFGWKTGVQDMATLYYNHTGSDVVFYSFASKHTSAFLEAVLRLVPVPGNPLNPTCDTQLPLSYEVSTDDVRRQLAIGDWKITELTQRFTLDRFDAVSG